MYIGNSNSMRITVTPSYQEELSSNHNFFWEYEISVENNSNAIIQLIGRHWQIICSDGSIQEVVGNDIVGERPILRPGESFQYTSIANLKTSSGIIKGKYKMLSNGKELDIEVPTFSLDNPYNVMSIN
ncbi:MAG: Co2+/Mg2+ efflux protein ApaG [Rickettsiales bacterium]